MFPSASCDDVSAALDDGSSICLCYFVSDLKSSGATLGKGVNREIATLLGSALDVAAHRLASFTGEKIECIILALSVFLIATMSTFVRFFPKFKARYVYGLVIFILTFSLTSVSGYRDDKILDMAHKRLSTIAIGGAATVIVCIFICPIWVGEDNHKLILLILKKLGIFLEGCGRVYFQASNDKIKAEDFAATITHKTKIADSIVLDNCISVMTTTGVKVNFQQTSAYLEQQELEGKRLP